MIYMYDTAIYAVRSWNMDLTIPGDSKDKNAEMDMYVTW